MKDVQELSLVLVKALYLDVENGVFVDINAVVSLYEVRKLFFLALLDVYEAAKHVLIVGIFGKLFQLVKVVYPVVTAKKLADIRRQFPVAKSYPAALSNAVGLVAETLGTKAEPVRKNSVLEYLSVYLCNTVDMA